MKKRIVNGKINVRSFHKGPVIEKRGSQKPILFEHRERIVLASLYFVKINTAGWQMGQEEMTKTSWGYSVAALAQATKTKLYQGAAIPFGS